MRSPHYFQIKKSQNLSTWLGLTLLTSIVFTPLKPAFGQNFSSTEDNLDAMIAIDNKQINNEPTRPELPEPIDPEPKPVPEPEPLFDSEPETQSEPVPEPEPIERNIDFDPAPDLDPKPETEPVPKPEPIRDPTTP